MKNGDKVKDGSNNSMIKKKYKIAGLSILEAIVSTAVVGVGFIDTPSVSLYKLTLPETIGMFSSFTA